MIPKLSVATISIKQLKNLKVSFQNLSKPYTNKLNIQHMKASSNYIYSMAKYYLKPHSSYIAYFLILITHIITCTYTYILFSNIVYILNIPESDTHLI
ncbi:hypothetical protein F383_15797 [Gossypium arboreum]|uniref:Uncharacterized protein n=1 Tax=Gossypium arboreum TaxID=29729 RepID=A0A0B0NCA9_GOSAR|nr:hypothetical protein F383_15797 [Gossypium arboreum]